MLCALHTILRVIVIISDQCIWVTKVPKTVEYCMFIHVCCYMVNSIVEIFIINYN